MSFLGNNAGRQIVMPGQISPAAVSYATLDSTVTTPLIGRNRVINGACQIQQRSLGGLALTTATNGYGTVDRYFSSNGTSAGTMTLGAGTFTYAGVLKNAAVLISTVVPGVVTGTGYIFGIVHRIEGYNCFDMLGQYATVSFLFQATVAGTYSLSIQDNAVTNSFVTSFSVAAMTPTRITIPLGALPTTLAVPANNSSGLQIIIGGISTGNYQTTNTNQWIAGNYIAAQGATNWATTASNAIWLSELQFEVGPTATPFERRPFAQELALCQRYYETGNIITSGYYAGTAGSFSTPVYYKTLKRIAPTVAFTRGTQAGVITSATTVLAFGSSPADGFNAQYTTSGAGGYNSTETYTSNAEL